MPRRSLYAGAVLAATITCGPAALAQTYVAPGGSPTATAPGGSAPWGAAREVDVLATGGVPDAARRGPLADERAMRAPARHPR